jgi:2-methylcitrate dehydratase PrpD
MPFVASVALESGAFGWDDYRRLGEPALEAICDRIEVVRDESLEGLSHPFGATLALRTRGDEVTRRIADPSGEPATFPDATASHAKFMGLAEPVLGSAASALAELFETLGERPSLGRALRGPPIG